MTLKKSIHFALAAGLVAALSWQSASAHETHLVTNANGDELKVIAGNNPEPVFEDEIYHTDLFLRQVVNGEDVPVNVREGADISGLRGYVLLLKKDLPIDSVDDPLVRQKMELSGISQRFGEVDRYGTPIKYTHDGAYGFHYVGQVVTNDGTVFDIDEVFVCGGGSKAAPRADGSRPAFGCVEDPVTFPGNRGHSAIDWSGYHDNDRYSLKD